MIVQFSHAGGIAYQRSSPGYESPCGSADVVPLLQGRFEGPTALRVRSDRMFISCYTIGSYGSRRECTRVRLSKPTVFTSAIGAAPTSTYPQALRGAVA